MGLIFLFFAVALLYSAVGFGGGSAYNALLILGLEDIALVPVVALACNLVVVGIAATNFHRHLDVRRTVPLVAASIPAAWLGGFLPLSGLLFMGLLAAALLIAGVVLLVSQPSNLAPVETRPSIAADIAAGGGLGLLAGMTGIGGGIYLAPLLYWRRWASPVTIAATCSFFILVNSLSGLTGQAMKLGSQQALGALADHWPLLLAVLLGGTIGSRIGSRHLPAHWIRLATAGLILYVAVRLGLRFFAEWSRV